MKKRDTVNRVPDEAGIAKQVAEFAVGVVFASIAEVPRRGEVVAVAGFGRFARTDLPARAFAPLDHRRYASPSDARLKLERVVGRGV